MSQPLNHTSSNTANVPQNAIETQNTPILQMPLELVIGFLTRLTPPNIGNCTQVCRQWGQMLKNDDVWRLLFYKHFPSIDPNTIKNFQSAYQTLHSNLTNVTYATRTLQGHEGAVSSLIVDDGNLFSCSQDDSIKVWDLKTEKCTMTFQGHGSKIKSFAVANGKLFSGHSDTTIKVWDLETGECIANLQGNEGKFFSLAVAEGKLFSGSSDGTIKVWDLETGKCITTLQGHEREILSLAVADGKLFSGSSDKTIKAWDSKTLGCTATINPAIGSVSCIAVADRQLFSGSSFGTIHIRDLETGECTRIIKGYGNVVRSIAVADGKFFSESRNHTINVWDLETGKCRAPILKDPKVAHSLAIANGKLFANLYNFTITIFDFTANHSMIFQEIAELLEQSTPWTAEVTCQALELFSRMPKAAKNAIYGKLYEICQPFANDYWGCAEHAFYGLRGQSSTPAQKAQAIKDYLNDQSPESSLLGDLGFKTEKDYLNDQPPQTPLLDHLGFKTEKDYLEKLKCRSGHLQKIGISSPEDVKCICSPSPQLLKLNIEVVEVEGDFRENKVRTAADGRKSSLKALMEELSTFVEVKIEEANTCGVLLYEADCPWLNFQQRLKSFQTKLNEIIENSNTAKLTVEAFNSKNYQSLANELNALVEEFHALDRDHQIAKLHAYVNQWGILKAWNRRQTEGVGNLSALSESEQSLQNLFRMGE